MKKLLLLSAIALATTVSVSAQPEVVRNAYTPEKTVKSIKHSKVVESKKLDNGLISQKRVSADGFQYKTIIGSNANKTLNPLSVNKAKADVLPSGTVFFENFEEWDGVDANWLPEGWSVDRKVIATGHPGWQIWPESGDDVEKIFSSNALVFLYYDEPVDEWVITPEFTVNDGMVLSWESYSAGVYYFDQSYYNPWIGFTDVVVINDFKVNISEDGGQTWKVIKSVANDIMEETKSFWDIYYDHTGFKQYKVDLSEYAGKAVKLGFQVVGEPESNSAVLDNVKVGYPDLDLSYAKPNGIYYFGISELDNFVPGTFMTAPVYQPVMFRNTSPNRNASFWWTYQTPGGETATSTDRNLTVTYTTDYTDEKTTRNNMYEMPTLHGTAPTSAETEYTTPGFIQYGGRAEYEIRYTDTGTREVLQLGMSIADPNTEGTRTYASVALPYFGYNADSDRFWSTRTFGDELVDENNWTHLERYANLFTSSTTPLVIDGVRTIAYGQISKEAVFVAEIYLLSSNYEISETPAFTATCTGDDILIHDRGDYYSNDIISLNFKFDEPVVISNKDAMSFVVAIGGFRDAENVQYFSPEMSEFDNPSKLGLGWTGKKMCFMGDLYPMSWGPVVDLTELTEPEGCQYISFYIMLDAAYTWLEGETQEITIDNEPVSVALDSYYDGSQISFDGLPSWLEAKAEGRYDKTRVTFTAHGTGSADVTIKVPGASKSLKINSTAGVSDIASDNSDAAIEYFNLQGIRIANPEKGQVVIKRQGSEVRKIVF